MKLSRTAKAVRFVLRSRRQEKDDGPQPLHLSTGSTLLNLALTDRYDGGFRSGKYYFIVGDSSSGKTFLSMTCLAEAMQSEDFKDHRIIYDNTEDGMLMDVPRLFGSRVLSRLKPPSWQKVDGEKIPRMSRTIEEFYFHIDDHLKKAEKDSSPFIYILDSMDGLDADADQEHFEKSKKAHRENKDASGSYGMAKAKANSTGLRRVRAGLSATGSILIIVGQTRENTKANSPWAPTKTRGGGKALRFYATAEFWSSVIGQESKTVRGKKRKIGTQVRLQMQKNRLTGKLHDVELSIYPSYGIDDIGSCITFLISEGWWKKSKGVITAPELEFKGKQEELAKLCESPKNLRTLRHTTGECWNEIEGSCSLQRTARYE